MFSAWINISRSEQRGTLFWPSGTVMTAMRRVALFHEHTLKSVKWRFSPESTTRKDALELFAKPPFAHILPTPNPMHLNIPHERKDLFFDCPSAIGSSQARDQIGAAVVTYTITVAAPDPLTHCARPGMEPASWGCRDSTNAIAPQQELQERTFLNWNAKREVFLFQGIADKNSKLKANQNLANPQESSDSKNNML